MASREISKTALRVCFGKVRKGVTLSTVLTDLCGQLAFVQKDLDVCGDMEDHAYYTGMIDAFNMVAQWIAPFKDEAAYNEMLGFRSPEEIAKLLSNAA